MVFYDFQCQRCGWDMERLVSRYVIEVKCPMCGYMSQTDGRAQKGELKSHKFGQHPVNISQKTTPYLHHVNMSYYTDKNIL